MDKGTDKGGVISVGRATDDGEVISGGGVTGNGEVLIVGPCSDGVVDGLLACGSTCCAWL